MADKPWSYLQGSNHLLLKQSCSYRSSLLVATKVTCPGGTSSRHDGRLVGGGAFLRISCWEEVLQRASLFLPLALQGHSEYRNIPPLSSPQRLNMCVHWQSGVLRLTDSLFCFNTLGSLGWDGVWGCSLAEQAS